MISTSYTSDENVRLSVEERMKNQLQDYLDEPVIQPVDICNGSSGKGSAQALKWWSVNCVRFKDIGRVARQFLSIPASSVASERIFSSAGTVIGNRRSNLDPSQVERLVFLNHNLRNE